MIILACSIAQPFDWPKLLISLGPIIIGAMAIFFAYIQTTMTLNSKKKEEERQEIYKKLNELYGPLLQLRMKSNKLYQIFREKYVKADPHFSTLTYLLNGVVFEGNDDVLLREIIAIGEKSEKLIHSKAGLIDDTNLRTVILPRATTHFLLLRLAYKQILKGDGEKYRELTFPKEMDNLLEKRKKELEGRLMQLNRSASFFKFT